MSFEYTRNKLVMPEYGRNVQKMVEIAMTIENRDERNSCAHAIVDIMATMNPQIRDTADYRNKLWDHLAIISDFKLDIDSPYPAPNREALYEHPAPMKYEHNNIKLKHYGLLVEKFIEKATKVRDYDTQQTMVRDIANYMKKTLLALNKDFATDDRLFSDINKLSDGLIEVDEGMRTARINENRLNGNGLNYQTKGNNNQRNKQYQKNNRNNQRKNNYGRNNQRKNNY